MENNLKQLPERFSVYAKTLEEAKYIVEKQKKLCGDSFDAVDDTYYRFSPKDYDKSGYSTSSYIKDEFLLKDYEIEYEFTFEEFKSFFEKKEEFPTDDFCVTNNGNNVEVVEYLKSKGFKTSLTGHISHYFYGIKNNELTYSRTTNSFKTSYTLQQLKELDNMKERKIIGYKCPMDLFDGKVKKGSIYYKTNGNCYSKEQNSFNSLDFSLIPKEIVEQWEAVLLDNYRDIIIGSNNTKVRINQSGKIEFRNEHTEIEIVKALLNDFTINSRIIGSSWKSSIHKSTRFILIGCESESNKFSIEELELIIKAYESLK